MAEDRSVRGNEIKPKSVGSEERPVEEIHAQEFVGEVSTDNVEDLSTEGATGTVPKSQGDGTLKMEESSSYSDSDARGAAFSVHQSGTLQLSGSVTWEAAAYTSGTSEIRLYDGTLDDNYTIMTSIPNDPIYIQMRPQFDGNGDPEIYYEVVTANVN
jgi:hypothetical protein